MHDSLTQGPTDAQDFVALGSADSVSGPLDTDPADATSADAAVVHDAATNFEEVHPAQEWMPTLVETRDRIMGAIGRSDLNLGQEAFVAKVMAGETNATAVAQVRELSRFFLNPEDAEDMLRRDEVKDVVAAISGDTPVTLAQMVDFARLIIALDPEEFFDGKDYQFGVSPLEIAVPFCVDAIQTQTQIDLSDKHDLIRQVLETFRIE